MFKINRVCWSSSVPVGESASFDSAIDFIKQQIIQIIQKKVTRNQLVFKENIVYFNKNLYLNNGIINPMAVGFEIIKEEV